MSEHNYHRRGKSKLSLKFHLIFVVKYRHPLLKHKIIERTIKQELLDSQKPEFCIELMEVDVDHIHMLIDFVPQISISQIVRLLKQRTAVKIWQVVDLRKYFWKERTFWSDGYFVCSTGQASEDTIRKYIESQG